jgi:hypothetical protein
MKEPLEQIIFSNKNFRTSVNSLGFGEGNWGEKHNNKVTKQTRNNYNSRFQII